MDNVIVGVPLAMVPSDGWKATKRQSRPEANRRYPTALNIIIVLKTEIRHIWRYLLWQYKSLNTMKIKIYCLLPYLVKFPLMTDSFNVLSLISFVIQNIVINQNLNALDTWIHYYPVNMFLLTKPQTIIRKTLIKIKSNLKYILM